MLFRNATLLALMFTGATAAPVPFAQSRDSRVTSQRGQISGMLVAADTGVAIRNARIALAGDGPSDPLVQTTDEQGAFVFSNLEPGRYRLWAAKSGYVTVSYRDRGPGTPRGGTFIFVAAGQRVDRLSFRMPRGAVISGTVLDEFGEPAHGAYVQVSGFAITAGRRTRVPTGAAQVDDRGAYRVASLPPGEYVVVASTLGGLLRPPQLAGSDRLPATADRPPDALFSLRLELETRQSGFVPVYFADSLTPATATIVAVASGEERGGVDIRIRRVPFSRVSGVVRDIDGSVPRGEVRITQGAIADLDGQERSLGSTTLDTEGRFSFPSIPAGQYTLSVRQRPVDSRVPAGAHWALQEIFVGETDVTGVAITLSEGITIRGSVVSLGEPLPEFVGGIVFTPMPESKWLAERVYLHAGVDRANQFSLDRLVPGRYQVEFRSSLPEWRLSSAMFGGRDALDFLLDVRPGATLSGVLTLTQRETELSGTVFGGPGSVVSGLTVIVFAADDRFWLPGNRRNQQAITDDKGRFSFQDLPTGRYHLAIVEEFDTIAGLDAGLLRQLASTSTVQVSLVEGEHRTQDLRIR